MIETQRLILRPVTLDDVERFAEILGDPITMRFWPRPLTRDEARAWVERSLRSYEEHGFGRYAVVAKESGEVIGDCGILRARIDDEEVNDFGYVLHHPYWGAGLATEAAQAVVDYAFEVLRLDVLHANMAHDHEASRRVAEKVGMKRVREFINPRNRNILTFLYERRGASRGC